MGTHLLGNRNTGDGTTGDGCGIGTDRLVTASEHFSGFFDPLLILIIHSNVYYKITNNLVAIDPNSYLTTMFAVNSRYTNTCTLQYQLYTPRTNYFPQTIVLWNKHYHTL